jgi:DNA-binding transcriptional ArsR family regulator
VSPDDIDDHAVGLIASRVAMALREELEALALRLGKTNGNESPLTVDDVAERLGVSRSTVYAHWREWGGYKLGQGEKAAIRFSANALPTHTGTSARSQRDGNGSDTTRRRSRDRRRPLLRGAPRLPVSLGDDG